jgi:hypothetical protein
LKIFCCGKLLRGTFRFPFFGRRAEYELGKSLVLGARMPSLEEHEGWGNPPHRRLRKVLPETGNIICIAIEKHFYRGSGGLS